MVQVRVLKIGNNFIAEGRLQPIDNWEPIDKVHSFFTNQDDAIKAATNWTETQKKEMHTAETLHKQDGVIWTNYL